MKKWIVVMLIMFGFEMIPEKSAAQFYELERLILDIEKLAQLKSILTDLYKGYEILSTGYSTIKEISEGNFNLHKAFLDGLLAVSPAVQHYARVADIISDQGHIVSEYHAAYRVFKQDTHFSPDELLYISGVYNNLIEGSEKNLVDLLNIMTAGKMRMSDAERLHGIDQLYERTHDQLGFLRQFNSRTSLLAEARSKERNDIGSVESLYGR